MESEDVMGLKPEQVRFFKENGYLILEDVVETGVVNGWQRDLAAHLGKDAASPETWADSPSQKSFDNFCFSPPESAPGYQATLAAAARQLCGGAVRGGSPQIIIRWPHEGRPWFVPHKGHIDILPRFLPFRFMVGLVTYAYEVETGGAPFVVWPGSHLTSWRYFQERPMDYGGRGDRTIDEVNDVLRERASADAVQFVAKPGTVLLWHSFLVHNGSVNARRTPRAAIFGRWGQPTEENEPRETFGDIWERWAI